MATHAENLRKAKAALIDVGYCGLGDHGAGDPEVNAIDKALASDQMIRNVIYTVQQNPKQYTVEELLQNMRKAIGVSETERV